MRKGVPNLGALQAFEATARLGSFSRAAEELSLTHSAVFRQVSGLEERLGVALFTRVRRRIVLTDAGAEYAGRVRHHLEQLEKDTFGVMSRAALGHSLHIAVLPTLATTWLIPRLPLLQARHPDIAVSLSVRTLPFQFADHPFDAAIYHAEQPWPGTQGIRLFDEEAMLPVCSPGLYDAARATPEGLSSLTHLHVMSRPHAWRDWYRTQGLDWHPSIGAGPRYELFTMVLAAVHAGLGVGLIPRFLAREALAAGDLVVPFDGALPMRQSYYFSYPVQHVANDALKVFEAWLDEVVATQSTAPWLPEVGD
ncbi:MAG: LysR substrate-binding domain-containing protein [Pusillimonas sp.]